MYHVDQEASPYATAVFLLLIVVSIAAGTVILVEVIKLQQFRPAGDTAPGAYTFGFMLASLAAVVVSVLLPERLGKAVLGVGAFGFFTCLAAAFIYSMSA